MYKRFQGSITVFLSLMLMIIASLLFALLETSRYFALQMQAVLMSRNVTESLFAEYNIPAYENYHLFLLDSGYGSSEINLSQMNARMQKLGQENLNPSALTLGRSTNLLRMDASDSSVIQYALATDQSYTLLSEQIVQVMKQELALNLFEKIKQRKTDAAVSQNQGKQAENYMDHALDTLEEAKETAEAGTETGDNGGNSGGSNGEKTGGKNSGSSGNSGNNESNGGKAGNTASAQEKNAVQPADIEVENPMEEVKSAQSSPLLAQVLPQNSGISVKQLELQELVSKRECSVGNYEMEKGYSVNAAEKLLLVQYMHYYTSNYLNKKNIPHAMSYEQEYLLSGKKSDEDNLKEIALKLIGLREGINFAYLMTDAAKRNEAMTMATAIATAAGIPEAAPAIQMGILASWAYAESIVEVRTLFANGKVAAIKNVQNWTTGLHEIGSALVNNSYKAREVTNGMSYQEYMDTFLCLVNATTLTGRFADLLEKNLQLYDGYGQVRLDCMLVAAKTSHSYQAGQVFLTFVTLSRAAGMNYSFCENCDFSYLKNMNDIQ